MKLAPSIALLSLTVAGACTAKESTKAATDTAAVAQAPSAEPEPTANDISNYKLDMDKMQKYSTAIKGFAELAKTDSAAAEAMASNANQSTAKMIERLEASPPAMKVLHDAGLTAKDYVWIAAAWIQAAMTQQMLEANKNAKLPEGQNPQNLEFLKAHKAELDSMTKEMAR
jgi:hypothetical protein